MPGLTIVAATGSGVPVAVPPERLRVLEHFEGYTTDVLFRSPRLLIAATRYAGYPIARVEGPRFTSIVEGRVYDATPAELERELAALADALFAGGASGPRLASLAARDGEFVVVLVDRSTDAAVIVTDRHGRLPLYRRTQPGCDVVSRELSYVAFGERHARLRPAGVAEFLLFGYPLGTGTVFEDVSRVAPASVIRLPGGETSSSHAPHDFDAQDDGDAPAAADDLAGGLIEACGRRAAGHDPVLLSLSGGLDSRMVGGALRRAGVVPRAVTHGELDGSAAADVAVARQVAARLGLPWELHPVAAPTGAEVAQLLALKAGANYLGMSAVLSYLAALRRRYGSGAVLFTGDLGDRLLGDRTPAARLRDPRELAEYLLRREAILAPELVAALTGCSREELVESVVARLATYPERTLAHKHLHFLFYERAYRWVYEGEDRNRCYCWHTTPFYAPAVFERAARVPDRDKRDDRLRARVLAIVAPDAAGLDNASTGAPAGASAAVWRRRAARLGKGLVFHTLGGDAERRLRRWLRPSRGHDAASAVLRCIRAQLRGEGPVRDYLRPDAVERLLDDAASYRREQFSVVLTVTSLIDRLGGRPVLDAYRDLPMV